MTIFRTIYALVLLCALPIYQAFSTESQQKLDYLSFAQGAIPVELAGDSQQLKVGMDKAMLAIDGNAQGFAVTGKPGSAETQIEFIYKLPAMTTFTGFAVPNVLETPSPSQTFFSSVTISGSADGLQGDYKELTKLALQTHTEKGQLSEVKAKAAHAVQWVKLSLKGGLDIQRDKTFFEFSEIIGYGQQEAVPLSEVFTGKWKGRGVILELKQDKQQVSGCYDRNGDLSGSVSGNLLSATGTTRDSGIPSTFLLTITDDGQVSGVRSTNGAPFRLYTGAAASTLVTQCSEQPPTVLGCGSIIHGINFDYDSATIRAESNGLLDELASGLKAAESTSITVVGHTSSEGSDEYNEALSHRRAESVVAALLARGGSAEKITAQGRGEKQPIADNATGAGRALNRRVEIECL
ncbi:MAG: OmpA family protein [Pseudomonadota bacterium]